MIAGVVVAALVVIALVVFAVVKRKSTSRRPTDQACCGGQGDEVVDEGVLPAVLRGPPHRRVALAEEDRPDPLHLAGRLRGDRRARARRRRALQLDARSDSLLRGRLRGSGQSLFGGGRFLHHVF